MLSGHSNMDIYNNCDQELDPNNMINQKDDKFNKDKKRVKSKNIIDSQTSTYNSDFNDLEDRLKKLQLTLKEKEEKIEELEKMVLDKKQMNRELSSKDREINTIKNENQKLKEKIGELNDEIIAYKKQIDNLNLIISSNK